VGTLMKFCAALMAACSLTYLGLTLRWDISGELLRRYTSWA